MKKLTAIGAIIILIASIMLGGCGQTSAPATSDNASNKETTTPEAAPEEVTLQLVNWGNPAHQEMLNEIVQAYKTIKPNVTIELVQSSYGEFNEKITAMIASGNPPDVTWWSEDSFQAFAKNGYFMELDSAISEWGDEYDKDDFYPNMWEEGKYQGKQYGIPFSTPAHVLFYNKKLFDEAQIGYPNENWTWDDLVDAAKKLTKGEGANKVYGITNLLDKGNEWQNLLNIIRAYGGSFMSEDRKTCTINSAETKKALQLYLDLING